MLWSFFFFFLVAAAPEDESLQKEVKELRKNLPPGFTEEQEAERDRLLARGFPEWKRAEFQSFMRGLELYGVGAIAEIANEVGLPEDQVLKYHTQFWKRYKELPEWEKLTARIERGEKRRENQKGAIDLLKTHFSNMDEEKIAQMMDLIGSASSSSKDWIPENDLWLLVNANSVGYGNWTRLQKRVADNSAFAMDWFMLSRTAEDLQDRVDKLLKTIFEKAKRKAAASSPNAAVEKKKPGRKRAERPAEVGAAAAASAAPTPERKKRAVKDKGPKKNLTAYKHFQKELKASLPDLPTTELTRQAGEEWKKKTAEGKKKYEDLAEADLQRYERECEQWEKEQAAKPPPPPPSASGKKGAAAAVLSKPLGSAPPPPTKPRGGYFAYQHDQRPALKQENPNASGAQLLSLLGAGWKALPETEKQKYNDRVAVLKKQYVTDMAAWRKKYPDHAKQLDREKSEKKEASKKKREAKKAGKTPDKAAPQQTKIKPVKAAPAKAAPTKAKVVKPKVVSKRETTAAAEKPGATKKAKQ